MSQPAGRKLPWTAGALLLVAFAGLSHYCNSASAGGAGGDAGLRDLGAALALGPPTCVALLLAWRHTPWPLALILTAGVLALFHQLWPLLQRHYPWVSLIEDTSVYALFTVTFGRSLLPGRTALCTRMADQVHGPLSSQECRYTRRVTAAWTVFFSVIAGLSVTLFLGFPLKVWSIYANFCVPFSVVAMFLGEYLIRRRLLPRDRRAGLLATVRVYLATPQLP